MEFLFLHLKARKLDLEQKSHAIDICLMGAIHPESLTQEVQEYISGLLLIKGRLLSEALLHFDEDRLTYEALAKPRVTEYCFRKWRRISNWR